MVTISRLALSAQENCVIILYFGEEREREGRDTKRENEVGRGDKDRKAEKDERSQICTHLCFSYTFLFFNTFSRLSAEL